MRRKKLYTDYLNAAINEAVNIFREHFAGSKIELLHEPDSCSTELVLTILVKNLSAKKALNRFLKLKSELPSDVIRTMKSER